MVYNINYQKIQFVSSIPNYYYLPLDNTIEIAFIGRSNSGKSSVINTLTNQKKLAKTSKKQGSTKLINLFEIPSKIRLIDFPGYGYSNTSKSTKKEWENTLTQYIKTRKNLIGIILIIDIRHLTNKIDQNIIQQINIMSIPLLILLNKSDKLPKYTYSTHLQKTEKFMLSQKNPIIKFSTKKLEGIYNFQQTINTWYNNTKRTL